jgi:hypothetical protein
MPDIAVESPPVITTTFYDLSRHMAHYRRLARSGAAIRVFDPVREGEPPLWVSVEPPAWVGREIEDDTPAMQDLIASTKRESHLAGWATRRDGQIHD